jgi:hypothetical protein
MQVRYQDIRVGREYIIEGKGIFIHQPRYKVKVLQHPKFRQPADFFPNFDVQVLEVFDAPFPYSYDTMKYLLGQSFRLNWRSLLSGLPWNDYGELWKFTNSLLHPLPSNIKSKSIVMAEIRALPMTEKFPGGKDYLDVAAKWITVKPSTIEGHSQILQQG